MRLGTIGDLITHAWAKLKAPAIKELGLESTGQTKENVSFLAPMVSAVPRRILDHANANGTKVASAPLRGTGFAQMLGWDDGIPIGGAKGKVADVHDSGG